MGFPPSAASQVRENERSGTRPLARMSSVLVRRGRQPAGFLRHRPQAENPLSTVREFLDNLTTIAA